jgi:hypothetical protein
MAKLTLAPEDDDSDSLLAYDRGASAVDNVTGTQATTDGHRLRFRFDPAKPEGRIIAPWPGVDHTLQMDQEDGNILADGQGREGQR